MRSAPQQETNQNNGAREAWFWRITDALTLISAGLATLALLGIVCAYTYEVASRYIFGAPTRWASDFVSFMLVFVTFLMLPELTRRNANVAVTFLLELGNRRFRAILLQITRVISLLTCAAATYISFEANLRQFVGGVDTLSFIPVPKVAISAAITVGLGLSAVNFLKLTWMPACYGVGQAE